MKKTVFLGFLLLLCRLLPAQELQARVSVVANQISSNVDKKIFQTLSISCLLVRRYSRGADMRRVTRLGSRRRNNNQREIREMRFLLTHKIDEQKAATSPPAIAAD